MYPVVERPDPTNPGQMLRVHEPIPFKTLKEFKTSVSMYDPTSPFVLGLLDSVASEVLPPLDWQTLAKACLSPGDYLMWKSNWTELIAEQAARNQRHGMPITLEMLVGTRACQGLQAPMTFPLQAYQQINVSGTKAWRELPTKGEKTMDITEIVQGSEEPYQDFVARLLQAVDRMVGNPDARSLLVEQLAFENANRTCQEALHPTGKGGSDFGCCIKGGSTELPFRRQRKGDLFHLWEARFLNPSRCWIKTTGKPGLCPRCHRGKHWASKCLSQTDINGQPLNPHQEMAKGASNPIWVPERVVRQDHGPGRTAHPAIQKLKITPPVMMPAHPPTPKKESRRQVTKATREANIPTWGQLKKLTINADKTPVAPTQDSCPLSSHTGPGKQRNIYTTFHPWIHSSTPMDEELGSILPGDTTWSSPKLPYQQCDSHLQTVDEKGPRANLTSSEKACVAALQTRRPKGANHKEWCISQEPPLPSRAAAPLSQHRSRGHELVGAAAAAVAAAADSAQWLSVKEETIFLRDGPIRVTNLAELPTEILGAPETANTDLEDF
ncbi:hypothetical protein QTO34_007855 [Cnephaeus nilssonii]|uniref:Retroviral nucleocapsid Gag protein p24 C-terminal domain-containing protein n=1 Tax=Cnephaeus nilssonii TaxID=3371016 RepID=A0AA40HJ38_CNENI|nr:hypothetical protein QTO34_007855 [Eptesicus nilssonii]